MLERAKNVVEALDAADNAQNKANGAILQANVDIELAKNDLEQVSQESLVLTSYCLLIHILLVDRWADWRCSGQGNRHR